MIKKYIKFNLLRFKLNELDAPPSGGKCFSPPLISLSVSRKLFGLYVHMYSVHVYLKALAI